ncbi:MAG: DUF1569 domain-containing protein [Alteromonadaceae bacterium]|nr:DUF1569 domain-containing protein [Alteromonadaceae bacterium]
MNRRIFIASTAGVGILAALGTASWCVIPENADDLSIASLVNRLKAMQKQDIVFASSWTSFQCFNHMAQSVEYSMTGYPEHKSDLFKTVVGTAAFTAFSNKGYMKHNLEEAIPGAPELIVQGDTKESIQRLIDALVTFENFSGELAPHFAYGGLTKAEYALAHVLHANDHFTQLV